MLLPVPPICIVVFIAVRESALMVIRSSSNAVCHCQLLMQGSRRKAVVPSKDKKKEAVAQKVCFRKKKKKS